MKNECSVRLQQVAEAGFKAFELLGGRLNREHLGVMEHPGNMTLLWAWRAIICSVIPEDRQQELADEVRPLLER